MKTIKKLMANRGVCRAAFTAIATLILTGCGANNSKVNYPMVATGQVKTYDADGAVMENIKPGDPLYGQDAHYLAGAEMSYRDNGDGTISDLNTGLMWQMVPVNQGFNWQGANDYCENLELAGYDDWRVPTAKELFSISDFNIGWPYINTEYFELIDSKRVGKDEQYWTSHMYVGTTGEGGSSTAFGVNHGTGHIKAYGAGNNRGGGQRDSLQSSGSSRPQSGQGQQRSQASQGQQRPQRDSLQSSGSSRPQSGQGQQRSQASQGQQRPQRDSLQSSGGNRPQMAQGQGSQGRGGQSGGGQGGGNQSGGNRSFKYVRAVRGEVYGVNDFADNGDGTISDKATGLMWAKVDSEKGMDWVAALQYAENAELAGYSDWRLPNVKELQGILDYRFSPSAKDPANMGAAIDPIFSCSEFVNENGDKDYPYFWTGTSALFQRGRPYYYAWYVAFGRAVNPSGVDSHGAGAVRFDTKHESGPAGEDKGRFYNYVRLVRNTK